MYTLRMNIIPPLRGFNRDPNAEPTARAPRSTIVNGTWPGYLGEGRLRTEKERTQQQAGVTVLNGGNARIPSVPRLLRTDILCQCVQCRRMSRDGVVWWKKLRWHVLGTDKLIDTIRILHTTEQHIDHYEKTCWGY